MGFKVGQRVETIDYAPGFKKSYYTGTVVEISSRRVTVKYDKLKQYGGEPLVDSLLKKDVRPAAPEVDVNIEENDYVNAWDGEGWRYGTCVRKADDIYTIDLRCESDSGNSKIVSYEKDQLRIDQDWIIFEGKRRWVYRKLEKVEFKMGSRVEMVGFHGDLKNSFYAGTVVGYSYRARVMVKYETLSLDNGKERIEHFTRSDIRPYPPGVIVDIGVGDEVDVWEDHGWWSGKCTAVNTQTGKYTVVFDYHKNPQKKKRKYKRDDVRIHQEWFPAGCCRFWSYDKV